MNTLRIQTGLALWLVVMGLLCSLCILPSAGAQETIRPPATLHYPDLGPVDYAGIVKAGWMSNFEDGEFHPDKHLNRAELATILVKAFELENRALEDFKRVPLSDVPADHWAHGAIQQVVDQGIMRGYRQGRFYPNQRVSRAEGFAIFAQAYGIFHFKPGYIEELFAPFTDHQKIPFWARKAIATGLEEGFINATRISENTFKLRPLEPMTRGDMAYALSWWLGRQQGKVPAGV